MLVINPNFDASQALNQILGFKSEEPVFYRVRSRETVLFPQTEPTQAQPLETNYRNALIALIESFCI